MDFFCSCATNHADDLAAGGAAHDRIIDQNNTLAFEQAAHRIQLELHAEVANGLLRLDESTADIVVADETETKRDAAFGGVSHGRGNAGVGDWHNQVSGGGRLDGKLASKIFAAFLHSPSENLAIGTRKINVLENAARLRQGRSIKT